AEVTKIYRYPDLNSETAVFGVIGDPVGHSLSPLIHNKAFAALGINAVYLPFRVPSETLPDFLRVFEQVPVRGYSVTIPHKEGAPVVAKIKDPTVERTQAANTLVRTADGSLRAYNTDYQATIDTLNDFLPTFAAHTVESTLPPGLNLSAPAAPGQSGAITSAA